MINLKEYGENVLFDILYFIKNSQRTNVIDIRDNYMNLRCYNGEFVISNITNQDRIEMTLKKFNDYQIPLDYKIKDNYSIKMEEIYMIEFYGTTEKSMVFADLTNEIETIEISDITFAYDYAVFHVINKEKFEKRFGEIII